MQRVFIFLAVFLSMGFSGRAQQNLFNVPDSELTRRNQLLFQQQLAISGDELQSNTTFTYGIGRNLELGLNLFNVVGHTRPLRVESNSDLADKPLMPFVLINAQKGVYLNEWFSLGVGGQYGFHFPETNQVQTGGYAYGNLITEVPNLNTRLITGVYHADATLFGEGRRNDFSIRPPGLGIQLGLMQSIIANKLLLVADYMGGTHSFAAVNAGIDLRIRDNWEVAVGYQFPNHGSTASRGVVLQLTLLP